MLSYLFQVYGRITPQALEANEALFRTDWDPSSPFEVLIDQIESAQEFATDGNQPFSGQQILTQAYNLVYKTGMFFEDCKAWNKKPPAEKTWPNFKRHFLEAQDQMRLQQTTQQTGYYGKLLDSHIQQQCLQIEEATKLQCEKIEVATNHMISAIKAHNSNVSTLTTALSCILPGNYRVITGNYQLPPFHAVTVVITAKYLLVTGIFITG